MARRIQEGDMALLQRHLVGADVLGDPARLPLGDLGLPDRIQQAGLAVIDMAHEGHHRGARRQLGRIGLRSLEQLLFQGGLR